MGKKYLNPPIVEAVCEFRFTSDTQWDLAVPGLLYKKIKDDFPNRKQRIIQDVELKIGKQNIEPIVNPREQIIFQNKDKKILIQVGNRILAVNCLKPYPTWNIFQPLIVSSFKKLSEVVKLTRIQRIGLRYINRIEIAESQMKLEKYFKFKPDLGDQLPHNLRSFMLGCVLPFHEINADCDMKITNAVPSEPNKHAFILDIDFYLKKHVNATIDDITKWIESAHDRVENIFEGCITDELRKTFMENA